MRMEINPKQLRALPEKLRLRVLAMRGHWPRVAELAELSYPRIAKLASGERPMMSVETAAKLIVALGQVEREQGHGG